MMLNMFSDQGSPFYRSTEFLTLNKLDREVYAGFIKRQFHEAGIEVEAEALRLILEWTRRHTYFTQRLCHMVFNMANGKVDVALVKKAAVQILQADSVVFGQYQQMLSAGQWNLLIAIAKEGEVSQITSRAFLRKHNLGNPSTVSRTIASLIEKNMVDDTIEDGQTIYSLNDIFLARWLEERY